MKVDIRTEEETTGFISKTTWQMVKLTVEFNEEEKQIIKDNKLKDTIVLEGVYDEKLKNATDIPIGWFVGRGSETILTSFKSKGSAAEFTQVAKNAMIELKKYLENQNEGPEDESFEL